VSFTTPMYDGESFPRGEENRAPSEPTHRSRRSYGLWERYRRLSHGFDFGPTYHASMRHAR
jgi:hypothetical protein